MKIWLYQLHLRPMRLAVHNSPILVKENNDLELKEILTKPYMKKRPEIFDSGFKFLKVQSELLGY